MADELDGKSMLELESMVYGQRVGRRYLGNGGGVLI